MDMYGHPAPDFFPIDDLLDFSNDDLFSSTTATIDSAHHPPQGNSASAAPHRRHSSSPPDSTTGFTDDLCVPSDDVAELEWLSQFVDDSFTDYPENEFPDGINFRPETSYQGRSRSKRSTRPASIITAWTAPTESDTPAGWKSRANGGSSGAKKKESPQGLPAIAVDLLWASSAGDMTSGVRRCSHCASEKTPQWRTGPLGPKTLCNACGVRYKSGRLVPEYRPAASPTFVLSQHSNSHRKVLELRRQKEILQQEQQQEQQQQQQQQQLHHHHHHYDFEVC